jgi:hypothetical protein
MARGEVVSEDMADEDMLGEDMLGEDMPGEDMPGGDMPGADVPCADIPGGDMAAEDAAAGDIAKFSGPGATPRDAGAMNAVGLTLGAPGFSMATAVAVVASAAITVKSVNFCIARPSINRRHRPLNA